MKRTGKQKKSAEEKSKRQLQKISAGKDRRKKERKRLAKSIPPTNRQSFHNPPRLIFYLLRKKVLILKYPSPNPEYH